MKQIFQKWNHIFYKNGCGSILLSGILWKGKPDRTNKSNLRYGLRAVRVDIGICLDIYYKCE